MARPEKSLKIRMDGAFDCIRPEKRLKIRTDDAIGLANGPATRRQNRRSP